MQDCDIPALRIVCLASAVGKANAAAFPLLAQRRVAAGAAIETLSISFELFENEICSGQGAAQFYPSLSRIKFLASLGLKALETQRLA